MKFLKSISRSVQEKVHLSYLKWALGVHRKASNVGVWGESGRYPLIYQSIRLTLNYFKRISSADPDSLVSAAFREQKSMKLPWYNNIKPLLKLDELYPLNHVAAFRATNSNKIKSSPSDIPLSDPCVTSNGSNTRITFSSHQISFLTNTHKAKVAKSKKFRVPKIIDIIQNHFKKCWDHQKSVSSKLSFYDSIKNKFGQESYLNLCKGFSRRCSTTQLRISAHDLEIERGRYSNTPREKRICMWCKTSMGVETVEDEAHVLFNCDLYEKYRSKLIKNVKH